MAVPHRGYTSWQGQGLCPSKVWWAHPALCPPSAANYQWKTVQQAVRDVRIGLEVEHDQYIHSEQSGSQGSISSSVIFPPAFTHSVHPASWYAPSQLYHVHCAILTHTPWPCSQLFNLWAAAVTPICHLPWALSPAPSRQLQHSSTSKSCSSTPNLGLWGPHAQSSHK